MYLNGVQHYNFSSQNKYTPYYNAAFRRAEETQSKLNHLKTTSNATPEEVKNLEKDLEIYKNRVNQYAALAKNAESNVNNSDHKIDFMA